MTDQSQEGGDGSFNIQAKTIHLGLTYNDVRKIALDVFNANFLELSKQAAELASSRVIEFTDRFLKALEARDAKKIEAMRSVDMQYALFVAQREYAKSGDLDLGDLLVEILADRASHSARNLMQIVLNESLGIVPKLTIEQMDALSLVFLIRYLQDHSICDRASALARVQKSYVPFVSNLSKAPSCYQHIEYVGCGTVSIGSTSVEGCWANVYPALFTTGLTLEEVSEVMDNDGSINGILIACPNDPARVQIRSLPPDALQYVCKRSGIPREKCDRLIQLQNSRLITPPYIKKWLVDLTPEMERLIDVWDHSSLKNLMLTSVGIAIAHANIRRKTGENIDLAKWII
jgi:hypothetical protein